MTFILSHSEALTRHTPVFAGAHHANGLALPVGYSFTANAGGITGRAEEFLFRQFGIAGRLGIQLRRFRPVLVHAHFGLSGPAGLKLADALRVPLVVTYHGQDATITDEEARRSWRGREYLRGRSQVMRRAGLIIAVSDFIRAKLLEKGYPAGRVVTHRNGIDLQYFSGGPTTRERIALFVGRFVEKKGCEYLLRALGQLREEGCEVRGVIIGDGPLRPVLERIARNANADACFTGFLPLHDVRKWLGRAAVVVVPSVTAANGDSEGLPTVILEAQAMSTPVVATRHAGNAEGVIEGGSAILVDERDVDGLAAAIQLFVGQPSVAKAFGATGRDFVESQFSITTQVEGLERLYEQVRGANHA